MFRILVMSPIAVIMALTGQAQANTTLKIEVREAKKSRLISADVWIRTDKGKLVRKLLAAGGRARLDNAPVGSLTVEARTRTGGLIGNARVTTKAGQITRAILKVVPLKVFTGATKAPPVAAKKTPETKTASVNRRDRRPTVHPQTAGLKASPTKRATPIKGIATAGLQDRGTGKLRVCRGDVFDIKGRRISGRITIHSGKQTIGFASVVAGAFSLFDLAPGTYRLSFSSHDKKVLASSSALIAKNKLSRVVLRAK